jgi:putative ABC transport system substrate-binding protein
MRRREFIGLVGSAAAWPLAASGQQASIPVIGYLHTGSPEANSDRVTAVRRGLSEMGFAEGKNVAFEFRWANGQYDRLPALASELARRPVQVLFADGGSPSAIAAKASTSTIPIVFQTGADPVEVGLVTSLNRPGGNITGVAAFSRDLVGKRLEILRELVPGVEVVAFLNDPTSPVSDIRRNAFEVAARTIRQDFEIVRATNEREIDEVFAGLAQRKIGALVVQGAPRYNNNRKQIAALAVRYRIAAIFEQPEYARSGGLISYGSSAVEASRLSGTYIGRILKGENPANMPVMLPTKIDLVINLKTAKALGIEVPLFFQQRADEVIE